jgi:hypothetical protein
VAFQNRRNDASWKVTIGVKYSAELCMLCIFCEQRCARWAQNGRAWYENGLKSWIVDGVFRIERSG